MWDLVSGAMKDPEQLRTDLDTMIELQRSAGRRGDPEREAAAWLEKLTEACRKRGAYQDQQAEGLITMDELRSKLVGLEETRKTALRELEALRDYQDHIVQLEADRDALLTSSTLSRPNNARGSTRCCASKSTSRPTAPSRCAE